MTKKTESENPQRPTIDAAGVNRQIAQNTEKLVQLEKVRTDSQARVAVIEKQRQAQLVEALTGNAAAQKRLQELNLEMDEAKCADQDAADAIAQVSEKLTALNASLQLAERQALRERARKLIEARMDGKRERRIRDLRNELIEALDEFFASGREIAQAVREFDPKLEFPANRSLVDHFGVNRLEATLGMLDKEDSAAIGSLDATVRAGVEKLLLSLDGVMLPGEGLPADRRLYRTTCNVNDWKGGEIISLRSDDASILEMVEKNYIEEVSAEPAAEEAAAEATA